MRTIYDFLLNPLFRTRPGMFIGREDLHILEAFLHGYQQACEDAEQRGLTDTPRGVPLSWLRWYIAMEEKSESTGGFAHILLEAAGGDPHAAWLRFFTRLDAFLQEDPKPLLQRLTAFDPCAFPAP